MFGASGVAEEGYSKSSLIFSLDFVRSCVSVSLGLQPECDHLNLNVNSTFSINSTCTRLFVSDL